MKVVDIRIPGPGPLVKKGGHGWWWLASFVAVYDLWAALTRHETLSGAFWRAYRDPWRRWTTIGLWAFITAHLFHLVPAKYDPLRVVAGRVVEREARRRVRY